MIKGLLFAIVGLVGFVFVHFEPPIQPTSPIMTVVQTPMINNRTDSTIIVQLSLPPYIEAFPDGRMPSVDLGDIERWLFLVRLRTQQQVFIETVEEAPFYGTVLGQTEYLLNSVTVRIPSSLVGLLFDMSDVKNISVDEPMFRNEQSAEGRIGFPPITHPIDRPTEAQE